MTIIERRFYILCALLVVMMLNRIALGVPDAEHWIFVAAMIGNAACAYNATRRVTVEEERG